MDLLDLSDRSLLPILQKSNRLFSVDPDISYISAPSPFHQNDLHYAAEPVNDSGSDQTQAGITYPTSIVQFGVTTSGATINTLFPLAAVIASQKFTQPVAVLGITVTYAMRNGDGTQAMGLYVAINDVPAIIGVNNNSDIVTSAIVPSGNLASSGKESWNGEASVSFSLDVAPVIQSGQSVVLYASSGNFATNLIWALVNVKYAFL